VRWTRPTKRKDKIKFQDAILSRKGQPIIQGSGELYCLVDEYENGNRSFYWGGTLKVNKILKELDHLQLKDLFLEGEIPKFFCDGTHFKINGIFLTENDIVLNSTYLFTFEIAGPYETFFWR
jgi:hypothetical protein